MGVFYWSDGLGAVLKDKGEGWPAGVLVSLVLVLISSLLFHPFVFFSLSVLVGVMDVLLDRCGSSCYNLVVKVVYY